MAKFGSKEWSLDIKAHLEQVATQLAAIAHALQHPNADPAILAKYCQEQHARNALFLEDFPQDSKSTSQVSQARESQVSLADDAAADAAARAQAVEIVPEEAQVDQLVTGKTPPSAEKGTKWKDRR